MYVDLGSDKTYDAIVGKFSGNVKNQKLKLWGFHILWNMEHTSEPNFSVLLVSMLEIFSGIEISLASSNGLTRPAGPDLVRRIVVANCGGNKNIKSFLQK